MDMKKPIRKPGRTAGKVNQSRRLGRKPACYSYPIDDEWKEAVRSRMEAQNLTQAELARRISASPPAIVLLFKPETVASTLVPAIHEVLGLIPPSPPTVTRAVAA